MESGNTIIQNSNRKWSILAVVILGSFAWHPDTNIVNVALPKIMATFGAYGGAWWIVTGYMIASRSSCLRRAGCARSSGSKTFILSLAIFCFGSALCGMAWDNGLPHFLSIVRPRGAMMPVGFT
jgi:DHA2 family multidrug resistance protein